MLDPTPELPDDTLVEIVNLPPRLRDALLRAGIRTVGQAREAPDCDLLKLPDIGKSSLHYIRRSLGLPSSEGVQKID
jgi:DNA-directed RNA polymerase alpha subunit